MFLSEQLVYVICNQFKDIYLVFNNIKINIFLTFLFRLNCGYPLAFVLSMKYTMVHTVAKHT